MSIVLKENEWAKEMIEERSLGSKPSETLYRVARFYLDNGNNKKQTRDLIDEFLLQCDPNCSLPKWSNTADFALSRALKNKSVDIDYIEITKPEMDMIDALPGKQIRRLAFTLLCLSKYWTLVDAKFDYWVRNKDNEIMSMANINTSIKRQSLMYRDLRDCGMLQFSKRIDNTNVRVRFCSDGDVAMRITDMRNLGYQYLMYHGEPYFECQNCGITTKISSPSSGRPPKYCKECAAQIKTRQNVNSVMRHRLNKKKNVGNNIVSQTA